MSTNDRKGKSGARKRKALPFGRTPREVYLLAARISEAGRHFARSRQLATGSSEGLSPEAREFLAAEVKRIDAERKTFEAMLVQDPERAIVEFERARRWILDMSKAPPHRTKAKLSPAESVAMGRAVQHVAAWIERRQRGEHRGFAMPVATLGPISSTRPVASEADLEKLLKSGPVRKALRGDGAKKRGGPKNAAIALVALATGVGEQTVKRAAGSSLRDE